MPSDIVQPVCDYKLIRSLCYRPYPNHPRGCPNFGKRAMCPPEAPALHEVVDLDRDVWAVWNAYPLGRHMAKMLKRHPQWTDRQLRNPLYWQGTARKELRAHIKDFLVWARRQTDPPSCVVSCPEACGCNLTATMQQIDIRLDWPPMTIAYQIVLVGWPPRRIMKQQGGAAAACRPHKPEVAGSSPVPASVGD